MTYDWVGWLSLAGSASDVPKGFSLDSGRTSPVRTTQENVGRAHPGFKADWFSPTRIERRSERSIGLEGNDLSAAVDGAWLNLCELGLP